VLLRLFKSLNLSYSQNLQTEVLLIFILSTNSETKVIYLCPIKFGPDIIRYPMDYWQQDIPNAFCHSPPGTSELPPFVPVEPTTEPQPSPQFPQGRHLLDHPLLMVEHFFFLMDSLFTHIKGLHSVFSSSAPHESP
jgi:hypothetical protein